MPDDIVVLDIAGNHARLHCSTLYQKTSLSRLGFECEGPHMTRSISDAHDRVGLVRTLIEMSALFIGGRDWSPSEIVELLQSRGRY